MKLVNTWLVLAAVFAISLQILLILTVICAYLPSEFTWQTADVYLRGGKSFLRKYDMFLYHAWIVVVMGMTVSSFMMFKDRLESGEFKKYLLSFVVITSAWLLLGYWSAFELTLDDRLHWPKILLAVAMGGNLITWCLWALIKRKIVWLGCVIAEQVFKLRKGLWFQKVIFFSISKSLLLRACFLLTLVLFALEHRYLFPPESLPFFIPLRYALVGIYTLSFAVPLGYMFIFLAAWDHQRHSKASLRAHGYMVLAGCGLAAFLIYVRCPIPSVLMACLWPAYLLMLLGLGELLSSGWMKLKETLKKLLGFKLSLSLLGGIQAGLLVAWGQERIKSHGQLLPADFSTLVYTVFVLGCLSIYGVLTWTPAAKRSLSKNCLGFLIFQGVLVVLGSLAWFKLVYYDYRGDLARWWFMVLGIAILLQPLLWALFKRLAYGASLAWMSLDERWRLYLSWFLPLILVFCAVYVPNMEALTAYVYLGECTNHTDVFATGPIWAVSKGAIINVDVYSRYGIGLIYFITGLMKILGDFSYLHFIMVLVYLCAIYFIFFYCFSRCLLNNALLAMACWMMAFRVDNSFGLAYPYVYVFPNSTVVRIWPELLWMILMLFFLRQGKWWYLALASMMAGFSFWYTFTIGCPMLIGHLLMTGMLAWGTYPKLRERVIGALWPTALAAVTAFLLFYAFAGKWVFTSLFWYNAADYTKIFLTTHNGRMSDILHYRLFLDIVVFCLIVFTFMATITVVGWNFLKNLPKPMPQREDYLVFGMSVYGLGMLEYFLTNSVADVYYSKALIFFIVAFYWVKRWIGGFSNQTQKYFSRAIAGIALIALVTNHSFVGYPNVFNISSNPLCDWRVARPLPDGRPFFYQPWLISWLRPPETWQMLNNMGNTDEGMFTEYDFKTPQALIDKYHQFEETDTKDATLIDSLTAPSEKVALISAYEVSILSKADRRPLFFVFPLMISIPFKIRGLPTDNIDTKRLLNLTVQNLEDAKPAYVFVERSLTRPLPSWFDVKEQPVAELLRYVKSKYQPYTEGQQLVVYKRMAS